ncbi:HTH domain-containing protein [Novosphingobium sp. M1R2S20]|uniref:HTH domain-containing protein n=1 Tax=Novosphingobium rhizovicinum TaxID=3228928 RepID=A0ABV3RAM3_9SPHN
MAKPSRPLWRSSCARDWRRNQESASILVFFTDLKFFPVVFRPLQRQFRSHGGNMSGQVVRAGMGKLRRALRLVHLLEESGDRLTLDKIAAEFGVSRRTAKRLRDALRGAGVRLMRTTGPVASSYGNAGCPGEAGGCPAVGNRRLRVRGTKWSRRTELPR